MVFSSIQRQVWASQLRLPNSAVQNMATLAHLDGAIDPTKFAHAFNLVVAANDVLRTQVNARDGASAAISPAPIRQTEIIQVSREEAADWADNRNKTALDMAVCGYDSVLLLHEDDTASWYLSLHHLITDAASSALVFEATSSAYQGQNPIAQDYYGWVGSMTKSSAEKPDHATMRATQHWKTRQPAPRVGPMYQTGAASSAAATQLELSVSSVLSDLAQTRLKTDYQMLSRGLSWTSLLVTVSALYLHRLTGSTEFSIGLPVHLRNDPVSASMIGPTMEMFPVDIIIAPGDTHSTLFQRVSGSVMTTVMNAAPGTGPPGDYDMVVNNIPSNAAPALFAGMPASIRWLHSGAVDPDHAFRLHMTPYAGSEREIQLKLDVNNSLVSQTQMGRVQGHFISALKAVLEHPDGHIGAQTICDDTELSALQNWGDVGNPDADEELVPVRLETALCNNANIVLEGDTQSLSGDQLWRWAQAFADDLCQNGMPAGARIGICLAPSIEAVVAVFGTLLAGGSFVPLDPEQPLARRSELSKRAAIYRVFSSAKAVEKLRPDHDAPLGNAAEKRLKDRVITGNDEAYLMFTSGSTGKPKPVPITHRGLAGYVRFAVDSYFDQNAPAVAPLFGSLTFDLAITTLFAPILAGGTVVTIRETGSAALLAIAQNKTINWCKATPSHLEILIRFLPSDHCLKTLVVGGEAFERQLALALHSFKNDLAIFNEYGPTEAVVGCMIHKVDFQKGITGSDVPIGKPAPGVMLRIMDRYGEPVPIGVSGELWVSHAGLTKGYGDDVPDDSTSFTTIGEKRFYRTGDLVRLQDDMELLYLGRIDDEIKLGGIRLNPTEVQEALNRHPMIEKSVVGLWSPTWVDPVMHCNRCGLPDNVPGVRFDNEGVCETCRDYDKVRTSAQNWFKTLDDLKIKLAEAREKSNSKYDCMHLLSGGKDSTYTLCRLIDLGFNPYVFTFDNGFIPASVKENIRRVVAGLRVDHEFATTPAMTDIFRDSLASHSNVCNGCFKTIYTLATNRAEELGLSLIVTGLSRGQLFETRLIPGQFSAERFDPDAIDRAVVNARKVYHQQNDLPNQLLDTAIFKDDTLFERIEYLDFFRYEDIELSEMLKYLDDRTTWRRPVDTGRSTNCLINVLGINTHRIEQGYHNYAVPYAWDVRLGHKTRQEAIDELEDDLDDREISELQEMLGYEPKAKQTLTGWLVLSKQADHAPTPAELRRFLADLLPAHAIPKAFVEISEIPLTKNAKIDQSALPAPELTHRSVVEIPIAPQTETEATVIAVWERILRLEPIGVTDDFFALGGDSLAALEMIISVGEACNLRLPDDMAFASTTPKELAVAIDELRLAGHQENPMPPDPGPVMISQKGSHPPSLSTGEKTILFDQRSRPDSRMYNVCRIFKVAGPVNADTFEQALRKVAKRHQPLNWSFGTPRKLLTSEQALTLQAENTEIPVNEIDAAIRTLHRPSFDLENGPLMRCLLQPVEDGTTIVAFAIHHVSGDHESFDRLWAQINDAINGRALPDLAIDYAGFCDWQQSADTQKQRDFWLSYPKQKPPNPMNCQKPAPAEADGFLVKRSSIHPQELRAVSKSSPVATAIASAIAAIRPYHAGNDIGIALVASSRTHEKAAPLFGYFLNPLPMQLTCPLNGTFANLVNSASFAMGKVLPNRSYPLAHIIADRRANNLGLPALNVLISFDDAIPAEFMGAAVTQQVAFNGYAVADLAFFVEVREDTVDVSVEYSGKTVGAAIANDILENFNTALEYAVREPNTLIGQICDATIDQSLLVGPELQDYALLLDQVSMHMEQTPDAVAVECDGHSITWGELDVRSRIIAAKLQKNGVQPEDKVIIYLPKSINLVPSILGVLRAGAAYVPLDPSYPAQWVETVRALVQASHAILEKGSGSIANTTIRINNNEIDGQSWSEITVPDVPAPAINGDSPAYIIFTSGSTGTPKGVCVTHARLAASTNARFQVYDQPPAKFALLSSIAFDSSVVGLFWTLASGGTILLPSETQAHDIDALVHLLGNNGVTHTLCVPTLYNALLGRKPELDVPHWPMLVIVAGEACSPALQVEHFRVACGTKLSNEYGVTEATVWSTVSHLSPDTDDISIGQPIPGAWVAIVDMQGNICPQGVKGELVIGGVGVNAGYINNPDETTARFGPNTDNNEFRKLPGTQYYRSGDQAVITNNLVRFIGRLDQQINFGGTRIEPAEIERILVKSDNVQAAVVVVQDARPLSVLLETLPDDVVAAAMARAGKSGTPKNMLRKILAGSGVVDLRLVAHMEASDPLDMTQIRADVEAALPKRLRPSIYMTHERLPRMPNGKLDRGACEDLTVEHTAMRHLPADIPKAKTRQGNDTVAVLTRLFQNELRVPEFRETDSFFDHGGHSLMVLNLVLAIEEKLGTRLSTSALFDAPSPLELSRLIGDDHSPAKTEPRGLVIPIQPKGDLPPIFAIQNLGDDCKHIRPLAARLGDNQPVYGIGDPVQTTLFGADVNDPAKPYDVKEIAAIYAKEIEQIAPNGPFSLLAICGGVAVAYEIAQQLSARGRVPELFIMATDWHAPYLHLDVKKLAKYNWGQRWQRLKRNGPGYLIEGLSKIPGQIGKRVLAIRRRFEIKALEKARKKGKPLSKALQIRDYLERGYLSMKSYEYRPYDGPVLILRGETDPGFSSFALDAGWGDLLSNSQFVRTPGIGIALMQEPDVEHVAAHIQQAFRTKRDADIQPEALQEETMTQKIRRTDKYGIVVEVPYQSFIPAPTLEQRNWVINQGLREFGEALDYGHLRAPYMNRGGDLIDVEGRQDARFEDQEIMENWQSPVMQAMADAVCTSEGDMLEVGYGRGVSAAMIQAHNVASHTIIECNKNIIKDFDKWREHYPGKDIRLIEGLWEDAVGGFGENQKFDGILFHTYPLTKAELLESLATQATFAENFFAPAARLLKPGGIFTYFTNEADSLSRAHQRALLSHFASFRISQVQNLELPENSRDAHWYNEMVIVEALGHSN